MRPDSGMTPEDDIQQALHQASNPAELEPQPTETVLGEVMTESTRSPWMGLRYAISKCALMAEKYPWQATLALLLCVSCSWVCVYFGASLLAALVLFAVFCND
jgi:hypothetical protein